MRIRLGKLVTATLLAATMSGCALFRPPLPPPPPPPPIAAMPEPIGLQPPICPGDPRCR